MTAEDEIRNLIARYAHAADDGRSSDYADLFTPDGAMESQGAEAVGREALVALIDGIYDYAIKHFQLNTAIQVDGDHATGQTDLLAMAMDADGAWQVMGCGRYDDQFALHDGKWLFTRRVCSWHRSTRLDVLAQLNQLLAGAPQAAAVS
jgi:anthranilate 1,2-dioxygenase small subunit